MLRTSSSYHLGGHLSSTRSSVSLPEVWEVDGWAIGGAAGGGGTVVVSCSSSSVTSVVAVGGTRACVGEADGLGVDVGTDCGGEVADDGVQERRNRQRQHRLPSVPRPAPPPDRAAAAAGR